MKFYADFSEYDAWIIIMLGMFITSIFHHILYNAMERFRIEHDTEKDKTQNTMEDLGE